MPFACTMTYGFCHSRASTTERYLAGSAGGMRFLSVVQRQNIGQSDPRSYPLHLFEQFDLRVALFGDFLYAYLVFLDALVQ